ncbi:MAG: hypothetical protein HXS54_02535 [Theionarchaea archaeon]|nr:hypothetical protein [Theionarchaea archaeon]
MVPNQTRYEYIPAWISVAHEVAHIAIDEIEINYYPKWKEKEEIRKLKVEIGETEHIRDSIELRKIQDQLKKGRVPKEVERVTDDFRAIIDQIGSRVEIWEIEEAFSKKTGTEETFSRLSEIREVFHQISEKTALSYSKIRPVDKSSEKRLSLCRSLYNHLKAIPNNMCVILNSPEYSRLSDQDKREFRKEIMKVIFEAYAIREAVLTEELSLLLFKNPEEGDVDKFFLEWKRIHRRAVDIAETALHILEGDTGFNYLGNHDPRDMRHVYNAEHILADILATLIAGEFYLYSLAFYRFLPSVFLTEERGISKKQRLPMSLRLFICLETLKNTYWKKMKNVINKLEILWIQLAIDHEKSERFDEIVQRLKSEMVNTPYELTVELLWNLIKSIMDEDLFLEKTYNELLKEAEEDEETKDRFDKSYFSYMRHALGNTLKHMLRNPKGFLVGVDCEGNCLKELIGLVNDNLVDEMELFTTVERWRRGN